MKYDDKRYQLAIRTIINRLPLCGCGSSERNWGIVKAILARAVARRGHNDSRASGEGPPSFYDPMPEQDLSAAATEFIAHVAEQSGLLEHGTSIGYAWPTEAGLALFEFLSKHGTEPGSAGNPDAWPLWAWSCRADDDFTLDDEAALYTILMEFKGCP